MNNRHLRSGLFLLACLVGGRFAAAQTCPCLSQSGTNYRSIGTNAGILHSGGAGEATIGGGASQVTFTTANLPLAVIGVGDQLTLDPSGTPEILFILSVDGPGLVTVHGTSTGHAGVSYEIRRAYSGVGGLQGWESARDGDLVAENRAEVGLAYSDGTFTGAVAIDTLTSSATNYMHLAVAPGHEHGGIAGAGVLLDGLGGTNGINILEDFTRVEGFELEDHTVERAILMSAGVSNVVLDRFLIHNAAFAFKAESGSNFTLRNSIIYDSTEAVHDEGTTALIENCTIYNMSLGDGALKEDGGTYTVVNTISMDNGGQDFKDITTQINNMSSDGSAVGFPSRSSANQFVSTAADNYHLKAGSEAIDNAGSRSFCCDVDGELRGSGVWDIGADEFNPSNSIYRSIGTAADYMVGTIVATDGWPVVYGVGTAWEANNRGRGDRIDISGTDYTILSVDSDTQLTLTTLVGGGDYSGGYTISRQFSSPQSWETCISAGSGCTYFPVAGGDLITDDRSEVGIAYEDGPLIGPTIDGAMTDAAHTITLTADGVNRHFGIPGDGVVMTGAGAAAIRVRSEFVTVEWIEVTGGTDEGVEFEGLLAPNKIVVRNMLVHDVPFEGILLDDADAIVDVYNNIVYNTEAGMTSRALTTGTIRIFNNTVYNNVNDGIFAAGSNPTITLRNNISHSNGGSDFDVSGHNADSSNNLSSDATGPTHSPNQGAPNGIQETVLANMNFVDIVGPDLDLHITTGSTAENVGADLSAIFTWDIDDAIRSVAWDIGAHDIAATTSVELVSLTARAAEGAVEVEWETGSELDNLGFHVYRASAADGPYQRLTDHLIPGLGSSPSGATYRYTDATVTAEQTYYYELEDVETTGIIERHGPIAVHVIDVADEPDDDSTAQIPFGNPAGSALRVVKRTANYLVIELETNGFFAKPFDDGSVQLSVPGYDASELPVKRTWIDVDEGRDVVVQRVWTRDVRAFPSLSPAATAAEMVATADGGVRLRRRERRAVESTATRAELVDIAIQVEQKKALVELSPFHWNGDELTVATKLYVRLQFKKTSTRASIRRVKRLWRLTTEEAGLYATPLPTRSGKLRLSRRGEHVPYHLESGTLWFVGVGGGAVYDLEAGIPGTEMSIVDSNQGAPSTDVLWHTERREESLLYQAGLVARDDPWLWDALFAPATKHYTFDVARLAPGAAHVRVWIQGTSDFETDEDHHVRVAVNGIFVTDGRWDGKSVVRLDGELPEGTLNEGENVLEVESVGDTDASYSLVMLDAFEVDYGRLAGDAQTRGLWHESGIVDASWIIDTTAGAPLWVRGSTLESGRRYIVANQMHTPDVSRVDRSKLLRKKRADWVLVGPRAFVDAAEPLVAHRRRQGLRVQTVATEDIYEAFGGEARPEAIRDFLRFAYHEWRKPSYRYVVLLGDGSYDFEDHLKTGAPNHVPPVMVRTSYLWTASDPAYAAVNGDDLLPDVAIGRLPARTVEDVRVLVQKILDYETREVAGASSVLLVADDADEAGDFEARAEELARGPLSGLAQRKAFLSQLGPDGVRTEVRAALDDGVSLVSYIGHGAIHLWADENVFNTRDIDALSLQAEQPILLTMNCLNGFFHFPYFDSLAEGMVKAEGKGAIAAFSPTGLSLDEPAHRYHTILLEELMNSSGHHQHIGDAVLKAQARFADTGAMPELIAIYHFFGDPALPLQIRR